MGRIGEPLLGRPHMVVEPVEQLRRVGRDYLRLGIVDMRIDETRHDDVARIVVDGQVRRQAAKHPPRLARADDQSILDDQDAVLDVVVAGTFADRRWIVAEAQQAAPDGAARM